MQAFLILVFLAAETDDAVIRKEMQLLEGNWKVVAIVENGKKAAEKEMLENVTFSKPPFDGAKKKVAMVLTYTLDVTKLPKVISIVDGERKNKRVLTGIYSFEGDTLKICLLPGSVNPPTEFKSAPDSKSILLELKREKK